MIFNIKEDNKINTYQIFNYSYLGQRFFAEGKNSETGDTAKFISSKGFDLILKCSKTGTSYKFTNKHFNPYLCSREKDVFAESTILLQTPGIEITDIGPSNFSGKYEVVKSDLPHRDSLYFETIKFELDGFDLFKYQNDDLYFTQYQSQSKDRMPILINISDVNLTKLQIVHMVNDNDDDYFDINSLTKICDADLGFPDKNSFYILLRSIGCNDIFRTIKVGELEFIKYSDIAKLKDDCGNKFIQNNINKKFSKRKYAFRYLHEYFKIIDKVISLRRRQSISPQIGPKEHKKEEFIPIFNNQSSFEFKIVYFNDIFTLERKKSILKLAPGEQVFYIDGYYDFNNGFINFYNFNNSSISEALKEKFGTATSMRFSKVISEWFPFNPGYTPHTVKLKMSAKANPSPLSNNLTLYTIPIKEEGYNEIYGADTFVNLYEFLANFAVHIPQIRNIIRGNKFNSKIFDIFEMTFPIYHVCRDIRRKIYEFDEVVDAESELLSLMIPIQYALNSSLLRLLEKSGNGKDKNSYWYSNINRITVSFPPGSNSLSLYQPQELQEYISGD